MQFTGFILELETPLHIGAGRGGMLLRGHGFVPGHVVSYALAAALGKAGGGRSSDFACALDLVLRETRCGPLFIRDAEENRVLSPRRDRERIETRYLTARNHVTLDPQTCSAVETALFEVESIAALERCTAHNAASRCNWSAVYGTPLASGRQAAPGLVPFGLAPGRRT